MPRFSPDSLAKLRTCHRTLFDLFSDVVMYFDCTVLVGHRTEAEQNAAFSSGKSQKQFPSSKHNSLPSKAVDVAPFPIDWNDRERFHLFAGFVLGMAAEKGIRLRWGGDWNGDLQVKDNSFDDLVHFELME